RATEPVTLRANVVAGDLLQRHAAAQCHGNLKLIPQHLQRSPHPSLAVHSKGEQNGPSNLTEVKHMKRYITCQQTFPHRSVRVIQQGTYKYSGGSQCQGLEHISATADATVKEYRDTPVCFSHNLPVPEISFPATKPWSVHSNGNCLIASIFSPSDNRARPILSLSVMTWARVISLSDVQPLSAMVSSSSSLSICNTFRTPASPSTASENSTGRPICSHHTSGSVLTNTPEAPNARALNTSVPRRTPPSRNTGSRPFAADGGRNVIQLASAVVGHDYPSSAIFNCESSCIANVYITLSIVPRSSASKFFNTRWGGKSTHAVCKTANRNNEVHRHSILGSVVKLVPVFYISFPAPKPWRVYSECNSLKASHFSPFHELPYYIPVFVDLMDKIIAVH
ncbi:hypothetical protein U9M48_033876, partial [Paspalum notatum var. saurae]